VVLTLKGEEWKRGAGCGGVAMQLCCRVFSPWVGKIRSACRLLFAT
jgi:hypothetical protein